MKNKKRMDNNGFSLVELIIVIAIMAVLIGVLAPQYMKYVERGRVSADRDNVDAIVNALQVYAVDPSIPAANALGNGDKITLTRSAGAALTGNLESAMKNAGLSTTPPTLTNQQTFDKVEITVSIDASTNTFTVTPVFTKGGTAVTSF